MNDQMDLGAYLADAGGQAALQAKQDWSWRADAWLDMRLPGHEFTSEDLTKAIGLPVGETGLHMNNAVGAKIRVWAKKGLIQKAGYVNSRRAESHAAEIKLWRKA
jgi:hypothetical protein